MDKEKRKNKGKSKKVTVFSIVSSLVLIASILSCSIITHMHTPELVEAMFIDGTNTQEVDGTSENSGGENAGTEDDSEGVVAQNLVSIDTPDKSVESGGEYAAALNDHVVLFDDEETKDIYSSIKTIETKTTGVFVEIAKDTTALAELGKGDICVFEDYGDSPFGETYFGKIVNVEDKGATVIYTFDNPTFDEVFDKLDMDISAEFDNEDIGNMMLAEGVSVEYVDDIGIDVEVSDNRPTNPSYASSGGTTVAKATKPDVELETSKEEGILFKFDIDLLEALGIKKGDDFEWRGETITSQESFGRTVYRVDRKNSQTGEFEENAYYHTAECPCVINYMNDPTKKVITSTVGDEAMSKHSACVVCRPPIIDGDDSMDGVSKGEFSFNLSGHAGLKDLTADGDLDWDINRERLLEDLYVETGGIISTEVNLNINGEFEIGANATGITLPRGLGKIEGLDEKLFPLACVQFDTTLVPKPVVLNGSNVALRALTSSMPVSVIFMVYIDIKGNITMTAEAGIRYDQEFRYSNTIVRDGEWVKEENFQREVAKSIYLDVSAEFDYDAHVGCSVGLYIFNLNVAEIAVAKIGVEGEGRGALSYEIFFGRPISGQLKNNFDDDPTNDVVIPETITDTEVLEVEFEIYNRVYVKFIELNIRMSIQLNLLGLIQWSPSLELSECIFDWTIWSCGEKEETAYNPEKSKHSVVCAKDDVARYYIDINGDLIKETSDSQKQMLMEDILYICGIDDKYIYVIARNTITDQDCMYRVEKNLGGGRQIEEDIYHVFLQDDQYIYYTTRFDKTMLKRINRQTLDAEFFCDFDSEVTCVRRYNDKLFVARYINTNLWFSYREYYWVNFDGKIEDSLGLNIPYDQGLLMDAGEYQYKMVPMDETALKTTVASIALHVNDEWKSISADGFSIKSNGIYIVQKPDLLSDDPIRLCFINPSTGESKELMELNKAGTLYTIRETATGDWYYLDQVDDEIHVVKTDSTFTAKQIVDTLDAKKYGLNVDKCSVLAVDNTLMFYQMDGNKVISIYRLEL